jgi:hypothetical protein
MPSLLQVDMDVIAHGSLCGLVPLFAGPHVPSATPASFSIAAQATHVSVHAVSQQKPSTQKPVWHGLHPATLQSAPAAVSHAEACAFCGVHNWAALQ